MALMKNDMTEPGVGINVRASVWISIWYWFVYGSLSTRGGGDREGARLSQDKGPGVTDLWHPLQRVHHSQREQHGGESDKKTIRVISSLSLSQKNNSVSPKDKSPPLPILPDTPCPHPWIHCLTGQTALTFFVRELKSLWGLMIGNLLVGISEPYR